MATPWHKNLCPGGQEIYNFGRPIRGRHCITQTVSEPCHKVEKNIFKKHINFTFLLQRYLLVGVEGREINKFLSAYPRYLHTKKKIFSVVRENKKLTHDTRQTTHNDGG